jgi:endonuclease/exonuclease/phosphatase family metal-dependent hydrolase
MQHLSRSICAGSLPGLVLVLLSLSTASLQGQGGLRIATWNTATSEGAPAVPSGMSTVLNGINKLDLAGRVRPVDVLALQEQSVPGQIDPGTQGSEIAIRDQLNSTVAGTPYQTGSLNGFSAGSGGPGLVYNSNTVQLMGEADVTEPPFNGGAPPRDTLRYRLRPRQFQSDDLYLYASHFSSSNADARQTEAGQIRADAATLPAGANILYSGDYNTPASSDPAYQTMTAPGSAQGIDPLNAPGNWSDNPNFTAIHTQSPKTSTPAGSGLADGGLDDRFDFQLITAALQDEAGLDYVDGSYTAFGNTNTHSLNDAVDQGLASALNIPSFTTAQKSAVLSNLANDYDHLPVVADYAPVPEPASAVVLALSASVLLGGRRGRCAA